MKETCTLSRFGRHFGTLWSLRLRRHRGSGRCAGGALEPCSASKRRRAIERERETRRLCYGRCVCGVRRSSWGRRRGRSRLAVLGLGLPYTPERQKKRQRYTASVSIQRLILAPAEDSLHHSITGRPLHHIRLGLCLRPPAGSRPSQRIVYSEMPRH